MKSIIIASTSTLHGGNYLEYLLPTLQSHFKDCSTILFIPYARPSGISHDEYTKKAAQAFASINIKVQGIHEFENPEEAIQNAEGVFTGGGNTFLLVTQLYKNKIMQLLAEKVKNGTPYLGTSAGSNICGLSMQTTNDMPIIYPPSFQTLGLIPFNLNPHYLDPDANSQHMGETRETRIKEFHAFNAIPVLGLREGSWLEVKGNKITLKGALKARLFKQNEAPQELETESDLSSLK
ncbi:dipeptidase PepE [Flavobacterium johnsoniae]|uniref:dipeptidase E n=1 Tax=Flavobacterium johnsoniae (strain ATCC 17061 / DSM 2064 / JCM 8514 / BCRC 14874 / CCUG 350202 / NBRC 14942 / NCIMB 11054 / UW101) TaxID=376686 RepID=A5FJ18_FLAJ1|nr:dipeptidase PepE [Flavobacterium johnsoniae]ABQ04800.1 Dipeptidase E [Flavobacterium johnsoniae UW101]OXG02997.1 dipeptidase E [Flavobacterium johnsoniae UW101]WQG83402.1 dipeptidase PepE [Flavobacterium johnsoniae UW101]SHK34436.1 dipeptidase E [Flavobacterium johnsoniae]